MENVNYMYKGFQETYAFQNIEGLKLDPFRISKVSPKQFPKIQGNAPLGKIAETLFLHQVKTGKEFRVLDQNIQIVDEKGITLGELDFILQNNETDKLYHIEMAYKVYILDPELGEGQKALIGPNRRDSFLEKVEKLKKRQFPLLYHPVTSGRLEKMGMRTSDISQQYLFKIQVFLPRNFEEKRDIPREIQNAVVGTWVREDEFKTTLQDGDSLFVPMKNHWMIHPEHNPVWLDKLESLEIIKKELSQKNSPMVWVKFRDKTIKKYIVVWW